MKTRDAFTLIEMIAVIAIIAIIIAIGLPAMTSLTRAQGLQGGVRQVSNAAQLARQFAITHRTQAELRIQTATTFCVYTNGVQVDKVSNLPIGVVIDPNGSANSIFFKPTGDLVSSVDQLIIVREGTTNAASLVATNSNMSTVLVSSILGKATIE